MTNGFLKYCKYYREDEECPYEDGTDDKMFWELEKQYNMEFFDEHHEEFENWAREYMAENKDKDNFLTSNAPIQQKGFVLFAEEMIRKWAPQKVNMIFNYGKHPSLIQVCRYYKGEEENPFSQKVLSHTFWEMEWMWVNMIYGTELQIDYLDEYMSDIKDSLDDIAPDVPISFKSFLYEQYTQKGGYSIEGFKKVLLAYIS